MRRQTAIVWLFAMALALTLSCSAPLAAVPPPTVTMRASDLPGPGATLAPTPRPDGLTPGHFAALESLERVDDHPLDI